jgi:translation elongation factor EF-1alpha
VDTNSALRIQLGVFENTVAENAQLREELAEARAEIERLDHHRRAGWTELKRKDALIEQMREIFQNIVDYPGHPDFTKNEIHSMQMLAIEGICAAEGGE